MSSLPASALIPYFITISIILFMIGIIPALVSYWLLTGLWDAMSRQNVFERKL